tara:strand:+ start:199 stop:1080 length:882 start_codon:yes stop_codon:yes gene_type:complete
MDIFSNFHKPEFFEHHLSEFKDKSISIFYDWPCNWNQDEIHSALTKNQINILILVEPNDYFATHDWAIRHSKHYTAILTFSDRVISECDNAVLFPGTGTWLLDKDKMKNNEIEIDLDYINSFENCDKKFEVSFLRGRKKNDMPGHNLRWEIYDRRDEVKIPTKFFDVLEDTKDGGDLDLSAKRVMWDGSMFHLSLENSQDSSYITEKVLDAFLTKTIPIYWGAPKIGEYFDEKGFFTFETADEAIEKMNNLTEKDYYDRKKYVDKNYKLALHYGDFFGRVKSWLSDFVKANKI